MTVPIKLKDPCSLKEKLWQTQQCIKKQRHHFADKGWYSPSYEFSSSHVECENWTTESAEELMVLNCGAGEDSWESLGLRGYQTSQS